MEVSNSIPKFYYEYYDSDGNLKSIEQDELSGFIGITNPSEIAYLMCCQIPNPIDDDQKVSSLIIEIILVLSVVIFVCIHLMTHHS